MTGANSSAKKWREEWRTPIVRRRRHFSVPRPILAANTEEESAGESQTAVLDRPQTGQPEPQRRWIVILFNDDDHTFDEVEFQLQKAIGCSLEVAGHIARTAHREGQAVAYSGEKTACERVAGILRQINLDVTIEQDG